MGARLFLHFSFCWSTFLIAQIFYKKGFVCLAAPIFKNVKISFLLIGWLKNGNINAIKIRDKTMAGKLM